MRKVIIGSLLIGASFLIVGCGESKEVKEIKAEVNDMSLFEKHDEITIKLATEEGYIANNDIKALIEEFKGIGTKQSVILVDSLQALLEGDKEKSEELYFKAMLDN